MKIRFSSCCALLVIIFSLARETLDAKCTICDNFCTIFNASRFFLLFSRLNYYCHFTGGNLRNWGAHLIEDMSIKDIEDDARALQSVTSTQRSLACVWWICWEVGERAVSPAQVMKKLRWGSARWLGKHYYWLWHSQKQQRMWILFSILWKRGCWWQYFDGGEIFKEHWKSR